MEASGTPLPELTFERINMLFDFAAAREWGRHAGVKK